MCVLLIISDSCYTMGRKNLPIGNIMNTVIQFFKYTSQSVAGMVGISVYILADTFFISLYSGADGLAVLNLILPVYGLIYAIGAMVGIGSATRYSICRARGENTDFYFVQSILWSGGKSLHRCYVYF